MKKLFILSCALLAATSSLFSADTSKKLSGFGPYILHEACNVTTLLATFAAHGWIVEKLNRKELNCKDYACGALTGYLAARAMTSATSGDPKTAQIQAGAAIVTTIAGLARKHCEVQRRAAQQKAGHERYKKMLGRK